MAYLITLAVALAVLIGFLVLTAIEARRGARVMGSFRTSLDKRVEHVAFLMTNVDFGSFLKSEARKFGEQLIHGIVHEALRLVRFVERMLTRIVKQLRMKRKAIDESPKETEREYVKTLSEFKDQLEASRPKVS